MDDEQIWRQAQNENTSPEILAKLAISKDKEIRRCIAGNPNTPVKTLEKLGAEFPGAIVNNPLFDLLLLENPESRFIILSLARSSTTSIEKLAKLANHQNILVRQAVVRNAKTTGNIIDSIFKNKMLRLSNKAFLENKNTRDDILEKSDCVRAAIAMREGISEEMAVALANDSSIYVRHRLVCNPNVPVKVIELLSKDIDSISKDGNSSVQIEIIKNVDLSPKLFANLASSSTAKVRIEVARHTKVPLLVLERLKTDEDKYVRVEVANNPNISLAIMEYLAKDSINSKPTSISGRFSRGSKYRFGGGTDYHHQVRIAIAQRKDISEKAAFILSKDHLRQVRQVLAQNANVPLNIIMTLCDDNNQKVQDEAIKAFLDR